jgi:hypothetical protein
MTNRRVNRRRSSFLLWSGMMQIIRVYDDSQSPCFLLICFPFCEAEEWRSRSGRNGRRKIAIDNRSMATQLSSPRLMPAGPSPPGNPHPSTGLNWASSWGLHQGGRNENGSTHGMGLRHNEHAVGARRMRNCLIQPYPDSQGATR